MDYASSHQIKIPINNKTFKFSFSLKKRTQIIFCIIEFLYYIKKDRDYRLKGRENGGNGSPTMSRALI